MPLRQTLFAFASVSALITAPHSWATETGDAVVSANLPSESEPLGVLSVEDASLYRQIFLLQEGGNWRDADQLINQLEDKTLLGYVQFQRYMHPTAYRSSFSELKRWLAYYADHPEADKIYSLARKRQPRGQSSPLRPITRKWRQPPEKQLHPDLIADADNMSASRLRQIEGRVRFLSNKERALDALKEIENHHRRNTISTRQFDRMRSWIAASLYYQGYIDTAQTIAEEAAARNGESAVLAQWIAGLISFREGNISSAHNHFKAMAAVPYQEDSLRAAAAFWAARTALAGGSPADVTPNLEIGAAFPFTFYGQLSLAQLGRDQAYNWSAPELSNARSRSAKPVVPRMLTSNYVGRMVQSTLKMPRHSLPWRLHLISLLRKSTLHFLMTIQRYKRDCFRFQISPPKVASRLIARSYLL